MDAIPLPDGSADFGYSLGVLHHVPDTQKGIIECVRKLKPGAPFLLYLYYAFDNRPWWFRTIWKISDLGTATALPIALPAPLCAVRPDCRRDLLAVGPPLRRLGKTGSEGRSSAFVSLSSSQFVRHANRCAGSLRHPPGEAFHSRRDAVDDGRGGIGKNRFQRQRFLVRCRAARQAVSHSLPAYGLGVLGLAAKTK